MPGEVIGIVSPDGRSYNVQVGTIGTVVLAHLASDSDDITAGEAVVLNAPLALGPIKPGVSTSDPGPISIRRMDHAGYAGDGPFIGVSMAATVHGHDTQLLSTGSICSVRAIASGTHCPQGVTDYIGTFLASGDIAGACDRVKSGSDGGFQAVLGQTLTLPTDINLWAGCLVVPGFMATVAGI